MSKVGDGYLSLLEKWLHLGYPLKASRMTAEQKLRTQIVYEAYQVWLQNKQIRPLDLCRRVASRTYEQLLLKAKLDEGIADFIKSAGVQQGMARSAKQLANDVEALNYIIGHFTAPTQHIEKAKVVDASDWLIEHGMQVGDGRDVAKGADLKMRLNKDFDEKEMGYEDLANTDVNITEDVSVVKPGRKNYTDEQKKGFAKRFGISEREVITMVETENGVYEAQQQDDEFDVFENQ
jgi:hypothetical protein